MKKAFPKAFDHVGNMLGTYTIYLDPSVPPAQHARSKSAHRVQRTNRKSTSTDGRPEVNHSSNYTNRMGLINYIPMKTRWNSIHMSRPKRSQQSNY